MGDVIGFDITPNSGSSLRKMLKLELNSYMPRLEAISIAATREHALELTLIEMKASFILQVTEFTRLIHCKQANKPDTWGRVLLCKEGCL